jgi:hypothetical protein
MAQIFISYSRKDTGFARKLAGDLEKAGYDVWWDLTDLRGGDDWPRVIPKAIESSQFVIVVLSPNSIVSDWVEKEYTQALSLRKKIIPILLERADIPFSLNTINYVDFTSDDYAASFDNLLNALGYTGEHPVVTPPLSWTLLPLLRRYAMPIFLGLAILFALLSSMLFTPPGSPTPTATVPAPSATAIEPDPVTATLTREADTPSPSPTVTLSPTVTSTPSPTRTPVPSPTNRPLNRLGLCVQSDYANSINVRSGPGTNFAPLGEPLLVDTCLFFSARNEEATWLQVAPNQQDPSLRQYEGGWIYRELLGLGENTSVDLPAVTLTPTPTASETPTITPTFTRSPTPTLSPSETPTETLSPTETPTESPTP